jgi:hypothetical protein
MNAQQREEAFQHSRQIVPTDRFGNRVVVRRAFGTVHVSWHCRCDCGDVSPVAQAHLLSGGAQSCKSCAMKVAAEARRVRKLDLAGAMVTPDRRFSQDLEPRT